MRLGGPVFVDSMDPVEVARAHTRAGFRSAYYTGPLGAGDAAGIKAARDAFAREDVVIAEVPAFGVSLLGNPVSVRKAADEVAGRLALADELGAICTVNIAGSYSETSWYAPDPRNFGPAAFESAVQTARAIVDAVKPRRAKLAYEMMSFNFLDTPQAYIEFLDAVDRRAVGVHLDPVNCVCSPRTYATFPRILEECFRLLGPRIVSCHAKDIVMRSATVTPQFEEVMPGRGIVDYRQYLRLLRALPEDIPLLLEHLSTQEEYAEARAYVVSREE